jgi:dihydrofolate reductase
MDPAQGERVVSFLHEVDTILIGHNTYLQQAAAWPKQTGEMADLLNSHAKIVFASNLPTLEWNNSRLASADPATEIAQLKQQTGKNIFVTGGAMLAQSLSREGLIDEYNLTIHPVVLGKGKPLFKDQSLPLDLKFVGSQTFTSGAIWLTYQKA